MSKTNDKVLFSKDATPPMSVKRKQRGMSLVQAMMVMVLSGLALSVAVTQYNSAELKGKVQKASSDVMEIIGSAKANYGSYAYRNLTTAIALGSGVIPRRLWTNPADNTAGALNEFGGGITLTVSAVAGDPTGSALLTFTSVPSDVCTNLVTATENAARIVRVDANVPKTLDGQLNITTLNTACNAAATVTIAWVIGRT